MWVVGAAVGGGRGMNLPSLALLLSSEFFLSLSWEPSIASTSLSFPKVGVILDLGDF